MRFLFITIFLVVCSCSEYADKFVDLEKDASIKRDSGLVDSGLVDSGLVDSGLVDSGLVDSGLHTGIKPRHLIGCMAKGGKCTYPGGYPEGHWGRLKFDTDTADICPIGGNWCWIPRVDAGM
jgi:hypothetical protein